MKRKAAKPEGAEPQKEEVKVPTERPTTQKQDIKEVMKLAATLEKQEEEEMIRKALEISQK